MTLSISLDELLSNDNDFKKLNRSLDNISKALKSFDNPEADYQSVIIAGTNGKGSVASFLEQLCLYYIDLKIGKFTSPHLVSVTERIQVQGRQIKEEELALILEEIKEKVEIKLSYFEKLSLASYIYFSRQEIDLAIVEVGMGGRWDCANAIPDDKRLATVITSIGLDHMEYLGDSLEQIRAEKEAIKREGVTHFESDFTGDILEKNYALAKEVFSKAILKEDIEIDKEKIFKAYRSCYRARLEYFEDYNLLLDSAHNPDAARELASYILEKFPKQKIELHAAFLDKDYRAFTKELVAKFDLDTINIYQLEDDRAANADKVVEELSGAYAQLDIRKASLAKLRKSASLKVFTGSIYFCGEVLKLLTVSK